MKLEDFPRVEDLRGDLGQIDRLMEATKDADEGASWSARYHDNAFPMTVGEARAFCKAKKARIVNELKKLGVTA